MPYSTQDPNPRDVPICIVGAGAAGLITAYVLLQDGFKDVQVLSRDMIAGGIWARERVYPELFLNNVHGEFRFTPLPMASPPDAAKTGGRLSGEDMRVYMETFADTFLTERIRYGVEVQLIERDDAGVWRVHVKNVVTGTEEILEYGKVVLCTGGCSKPSFPEKLTLPEARDAGFAGLVFHSAEFGQRLPDLLAAVPALAPPESTSDIKSAPQPIVVIGGGKSAQDISSYLARQNRPVTLIYSTTDSALASTSPIPDFFRKSRFLSVLSPHITLRTRLERLLHTTWLGGKLIAFIWRQLDASARAALRLPQHSLLRHSTSLFWGVRTNDEGVVRQDGFHALVNSGRINVLAPVRVTGYDSAGAGVVLEGGGRVRAAAVVLCTGYESSWTDLVDEKTSRDIGITPTHIPTHINTQTWDYTSLSSPPPSHPQNSPSAPFYAIHRGMVPALNISRRDFALGGALFTINKGYTFEVQAHWISGYFLHDAALSLPGMGEGESKEEPSVERTMEVCAREAAWMRRRWPSVWMGGNPSHNSTTSFWNWIQSIDDLLEDMGLPCQRSGLWPFYLIDVMEIARLGEERRALRERRMRKEGEKQVAGAL